MAALKAEGIRRRRLGDGRDAGAPFAPGARATPYAGRPTICWRRWSLGLRALRRRRDKPFYDGERSLTSAKGLFVTARTGRIQQAASRSATASPFVGRRSRTPTPRVRACDSSTLDGRSA